MTQHSLVLLSNSEPIRLTPNGTHSGIDITMIIGASYNNNFISIERL